MGSGWVTYEGEGDDGFEAVGGHLLGGMLQESGMTERCSYAVNGCR